MLPADQFGDGVDFIGRERDDGGASRLPRDLAVAGEFELRESRPCDDRRTRQQPLDDRTHCRSAQQQRLVAAAVNGKRALVVLEREGAKRQALWLTLEPKLAWGAWVPFDLPFGTAFDIALAPNGKRLAVLARTERGGIGNVYDLANGKPIASGTVNSLSAEIGFADDNTVALGGFEGLSWIDLATKDPKLSPMTSSSRSRRARCSSGRQRRRCCGNAGSRRSC